MLRLHNQRLFEQLLRRARVNLLQRRVLSSIASAEGVRMAEATSDVPVSVAPFGIVGYTDQARAIPYFAAAVTVSLRRPRPVDEATCAACLREALDGRSAVAVARALRDVWRVIKHEQQAAGVVRDVLKNRSVPDPVPVYLQALAMVGVVEPSPGTAVAGATVVAEGGQDGTSGLLEAGTALPPSLPPVLSSCRSLNCAPFPLELAVTCLSVLPLTIDHARLALDVAPFMTVQAWRALVGLFRLYGDQKVPVDARLSQPLPPDWPTIRPEDRVAILMTLVGRGWVKEAGTFAGSKEGKGVLGGAAVEGTAASDGSSPAVVQSSVGADISPAPAVLPCGRLPEESVRRMTAAYIAQERRDAAAWRAAKRGMTVVIKPLVPDDVHGDQHEHQDSHGGLDGSAAHDDGPEVSRAEAGGQAQDEGHATGASSFYFGPVPGLTLFPARLLFAALLNKGQARVAVTLAAHDHQLQLEAVRAALMGTGQGSSLNPTGSVHSADAAAIRSACRLAKQVGLDGASVRQAFPGLWEVTIRIGISGLLWAYEGKQHYEGWPADLLAGSMHLSGEYGAVFRKALEDWAVRRAERASRPAAGAAGAAGAGVTKDKGKGDTGEPCDGPTALLSFQQADQAYGSALALSAFNPLGAAPAMATAVQAWVGAVQALMTGMRPRTAPVLPSFVTLPIEVPVIDVDSVEALEQVGRVLQDMVRQGRARAAAASAAAGGLATTARLNPHEPSCLLCPGPLSSSVDLLVGLDSEWSAALTPLTSTQVALLQLAVLPAWAVDERQQREGGDTDTPDSMYVVPMSVAGQAVDPRQGFVMLLDMPALAVQAAREGHDGQASTIGHAHSAGTAAGTGTSAKTSHGWARLNDALRQVLTPTRALHSYGGDRQDAVGAEDAPARVAVLTYGGRTDLGMLHRSYPQLTVFTAHAPPPQAKAQGFAEGTVAKGRGGDKRSGRFTKGKGKTGASSAASGAVTPDAGAGTPQASDIGATAVEDVEDDAPAAAPSTAHPDRALLTSFHVGPSSSSAPHGLAAFDLVDVVRAAKGRLPVLEGSGEKEGQVLVTDPNAGGLTSLCLRLLGQRLDKTYQNSLWTRRPLLHAQRVYASLDAVVLPRLLAMMRAHVHGNGAGKERT